MLSQCTYHSLFNFGNISKFSEQGLEKLNDLTTKDYLHSTNNRETEALHQLNQKRKT